MGNEHDEGALVEYQGGDIAVSRPTDVVLNEAQKAAVSLKKVIAGKEKPVIIRGEQYLEFEDWQTLGRFYGVSAKVESTTLIEMGDAIGYEAKAVAIRSDGMEISAAESMCMNNEDKWQGKPIFQVRSMAQTRACAKALRNVLAWVAVLAGYKPTPAEEMQGVFNEGDKQSPPQRGGQKSGGKGASVKQQNAIHAILGGMGVKDELAKAMRVQDILGLDSPPNSMSDLNSADASKVIKTLSEQAKEEGNE